MYVRQADNIEKFYMQLRRWENIYKNKVSFNRLSLKEKNILGNNEKYRGLYEGKRCFVIGNGPSVNKVDFSQLKNELVITVNEMVRHQDFDKMKSNFHFLADPAYLKLNKHNDEEAEIIEKMSLLRESNTVLFLPINGMNMVKRYGWLSKLNINFFASNLYFYDGYKESIDYTKYIPAFQAVVQWGISFAVYMGCKEIYLLGCDATNIVTDLSLFVDRDIDLDYAYGLSEQAAKAEKRKHRNRGLEYSLYGYWKIVHLFSELYHYCERNKVKLYNCSEGSILDCIPKKKFEDVWKELGK